MPLTWQEYDNNHKFAADLVHYCPDELIDAVPNSRCIWVLPKVRGSEPDLLCIDAVGL